MTDSSTKYLGVVENALRTQATQLQGAARAIFQLLEHATNASPDQRRDDLRRASAIIQHLQERGFLKVS